MNASSNTSVARTVAWTLAPVVWLVAFFVWFGSGSESGPVATVLVTVLLALPAPWLLWASWRLPRPSAAAYVAEGGALLTMLVSLYVAVLAFSLGAEPDRPSVWLSVIFFAAAAVFMAAAWPLPGRRIAYGAAALACVVLGVGLRVLHSETAYYPGIDFMTKDELFASVFLGVPAAGVLLQIAWWLRSRVRRVS